MPKQATEAAIKLAEKSNVDIDKVEATGTSGDVTKEDVQDYIEKLGQAQRNDDTGAREALLEDQTEQFVDCHLNPFAIDPNTVSLRIPVDGEAFDSVLFVRGRTRTLSDSLYKKLSAKRTAETPDYPNGIQLVKKGGAS